VATERLSTAYAGPACKDEDNPPEHEDLVALVAMATKKLSGGAEGGRRRQRFSLRSITLRRRSLAVRAHPRRHPAVHESVGGNAPSFHTTEHFAVPPSP
jgi:hypothetical protein